MPAGFAQLGPDEYIYTDPVTGDQKVGKKPTPAPSEISASLVPDSVVQTPGPGAVGGGSNREAWAAPPPGMLTQPGGRGGMPANAVAPRFGVSEAPRLFRDRNAKPEQPRVNTESMSGSNLPPGMASLGQNRMDRGVGRGGSMDMQKPMPFKPGLGGGQGAPITQYSMANIPRR